MALVLKNLDLKVGDKQLLKEVSFSVNPGEVVALMGPNGCGKSSLALGLSGHPNYVVDSRKSLFVSLDGESLIDKTADERSRAGLFLAFQSPVAVPGVNVTQLLTAALRQREAEDGRRKALEIKMLIKEKAKELEIGDELLARDVNDGLSGGERKRMEMLQLLVLTPRYAILDETDSGLDVDALRLVGKTIRKMADEGMGVLVITHYQRLLQYLKPDKVVVLGNGGVVRTGGAEVIASIEEEGYQTGKDNE